MTCTIQEEMLRFSLNFSPFCTK